MQKSITGQFILEGEEHFTESSRRIKYTEQKADILTSKNIMLNEAGSK